MPIAGEQGERTALHVYLTPDVHAAIKQTAEIDAGGSVSAFLEALGADMIENPWSEGGFPRWPELSKETRQVGADRRRRTGDGPATMPVPATRRARARR